MKALVRRPVDGEVHVHYGQIYVESDPDDFGVELGDAFAGQRAGLCGAAVPGALFLLTGLHTGHVGFTVEVHDQAPPLDPAWEEVVEASFRPVSQDSSLVQWAGEDSWQLGLEEIDYRVRYCAKGMDAANELDTRLDKEPQQDCYLLQFWPAAAEPDRIVKQTSKIAAYWHDYARKQPAPPSPAALAEAERQARLAQEQKESERQLAYERWEWGGQLPSETLRNIRGNVRGLLPYDPALVHALDAAGPDTQRAVAVLAARLACEAAGLADLDWVAEALAALTEGRGLPSPFDNWERMWDTMASDPRVPGRTVGEAVPPKRPPFQPPGHDGSHTSSVVMSNAVVSGVSTRPSLAPDPSAEAASSKLLAVTIGTPPMSRAISQPHMALPAVPAAAEADPLQAALDAVFAAVVTYGEDYPALLQHIWNACRTHP
ncbi:hypothetical protein BN159_0520 [Streptomyces davaonensis JCM 4913]|uniref:Uncharacterized protein n=1 Tax=Streptomyces davaonensis (strain DSM 101723 / JCM 4913 / KCC S-0913 / 768) TaxID=1214101 RepID=K4QX02_STRDJ|nr:hypothetical protein [Streptomyces davaonensis]CCK24899.1 hypothetical protein BN159_0520 [Streptomyces davaonensis JCM 4913]